MPHHFPSTQLEQVNKMFDGLGGSVQRTRPNLNSIDPTLDACCQREVRHFQYIQAFFLHISFIKLSTRFISFYTL